MDDAASPNLVAPSADPHLGAAVVAEAELNTRIAALGAQITADYEGRSLLLVGVLKGAFMFMADLSRAIDLPVEFDFMAVSSYGSATKTSGIVRIVKDLDLDLTGRDVLVVEDIVDSGLTLKYLLKNLWAREPASLEVCALLRKECAAPMERPLRYVGFEIPNDFVVGYGLDAAEQYRNLRAIHRYLEIDDPGVGRGPVTIGAGPTNGGTTPPVDRMTGDARSPDAADLDAVLADARRDLVRLDPHEASAALSAGALLVDIRPEALRRDEGEMAGSIVIDRNVLEWRLAPSSAARAPDLPVADRVVVIVCSEGYASSLAAASLRRLGIAGATDLDGGYRAWKAAGLPWGPVGTGDDRTAPPVPG